MDTSWIVVGLNFLDKIVTEVYEEEKRVKVQTSEGFIPVKQFWGFHELQELREKGYLNVLYVTTTLK
jgi:hypothetical protein